MFRLCVGAALALAVWKEFWRWALPKKKLSPFAILIDATMKGLYKDSIRELLRPAPFMLWYQKPQTIDEYVREALEFDLPHERYYYKLKLWWSNNKPIITTPKKRDEYHYD